MCLSIETFCTPASFSPSLYGVNILNVSASLVQNYSTVALSKFNYNHPTNIVENETFCNLTITYTHPGQNDNIIMETWLPETSKYNGRMQAVGGGGWVSGRFFLSYTSMAGAIAEGYATMTTDSGLGSANDPRPWAQVSPGNVDLYALQNFGSLALYEEAVMMKDMIKQYYGGPPMYSYWSGCSQGGRQGLMLAQRYPDLYDGVAASAPANNWNEFIPSSFYPQLIMNSKGLYPRTCELDFIAAEFIKACDGIDGVVDNLVSNPDACQFDPFSLVGHSLNCSATGANITLSEGAAIISNVSWAGPRTSDGKFIWYGENPGTKITGNGQQASVAGTTCVANGTCTVIDNGLGSLWIQLFGLKDPDFNMTAITHEQFDEAYYHNKQSYDNIYSANDPDLSRFRDAGGKMLAYHGQVNDEIILPKGTENYYDAVTAVTPYVHDFYRFYMVPGLMHCSGGNGGQPTAIWAALTAWVENGTVLYELPTSFPNQKNGTTNRKLCPYPANAVYDGAGDPDVAASFNCIE